MSPSLLLGPMLRHVDDTSATIWVETDTPCTVAVLDTETTTFTVDGHHYALVIVEGLEPRTVIDYDVRLDGRPAWPEPDSGLPPSVIRTATGDDHGTTRDDVTVLIGSCRAAAPHEPPYSLELALDENGRGVDTLWAHAQQMLDQDVAEWPSLLLLVGDQIYADDSSPRAKDRIEQRRPDDAELPAEIVARFEEYCWLYHEAWSQPLERWMLSVVPSSMIFDDHDMIDDWNISASWVESVRSECWWNRHAVDGLMSYWIYQHLGNLSPQEIRDEGLLDRLMAASDGGGADRDATATLRRWADHTNAAVGGAYRFSFVRHVGDVTVVVIDSRNARALEPGSRLMVESQEWNWIAERAHDARGHLILATSLPVFIADGLHDLQVWNERVCDGVWGRRAATMGERIRRALDLEDWAAFAASYRRFVDLVDSLRMASTPPSSIVVASGDIHFSYAARVPRGDRGGPEVWQIVSSPIRHALIPPQCGVMRATLTSVGTLLGSMLRRSVGAPRTRPGMQLEAGPFFANNMCAITYGPHGAVSLVIEQSSSSDDEGPYLREVASVTLVEPKRCGTFQRGLDGEKTDRRNTLSGRHRLRDRWFARFWSHVADGVDEMYGRHKDEVLTAIPKRIVEIGPGLGSNFDRFPTGASVVAFEPNEAMHEGLRRAADRYGIDLDVRAGDLRDADLADASVAMVVSTLVLCSVGDQAAMVAEIRRILEPGGRFVFVEHVASDDPRLRRLQKAIRLPWGVVGDGCDPAPDTVNAIENAGFAEVHARRGVVGSKLNPAHPVFWGEAIR